MAMNFFYANIEFFVFILFMALFLVYKRKHIKISGKYPSLYMVMYHTRLGLDKMKKWSKNYPKFFTYLSYFSIFIGVVGIFASTIFMFYQLNFIVDKGLTAGGGMVLPIKTEAGLNSTVPVFYVPFWYWLIALFVLIIVHEFAHGVIAEKWKIKVKSSGLAFGGAGIIGVLVILYQLYNYFVNSIFDLGLIFFGVVLLFLPIMPAAFVEPDEKSLKKAKWWKQIAVLGAGSMSNFIFGFLFFLLAVFVANPLGTATTEISEINFYGVDNLSGFTEYNISNGQILAINDVVNKGQIMEKIVDLEKDTKYNLTIKSGNNTNVYEIVTIENKNNPDKGMLGIFNVKKKYEPKEGYKYLGQFAMSFSELVWWIWLLNIGIGIMNLLPIWITDGGQITYVLLKRKFNEKRAAMFFNIISFVVLALIIFTLKPSLLFYIIGLI